MSCDGRRLFDLLAYPVYFSNNRFMAVLELWRAVCKVAMLFISPSPDLLGGKFSAVTNV